MYRYLFACLLAWGWSISAYSQDIFPPRHYGARPQLTLSLTTPSLNTWVPGLAYDYSKLNPGFRSATIRTRTCGTIEMEAIQQAQYAGETESTGTFEHWMDSTLTQKQRSRSLFRFGQEEIYRIPVVVHVIHSNSLENISDEQIRSQIRVLNEDYRRQNPDRERTPREFRNIAADTGIEFCLATRDPNGNPTNGIDRISMPGSPFDQRYLNEHIKPLTIWNPEQYLNIWVCNIAGGVLGFAQFPVSSGLVGIPNLPATAMTDGIVINYNAFGTQGTATAPFNRGRTTTHELGHWLGLRHIWGDGPCGVDDYCDDTPEIDDPHYACPPGAAGCDGNPALVQNFMDYTDDICMNMFTRDQRSRMRAVLENSPRRRSLLESPACGMQTLPPEPAFMADVQAGCSPLVVNFQDLSQGEVLEYAWYFPGGRPERASGPRPQVSYRQPGVYPVSLRVSNAGGSRTRTEEGFIQVRVGGQPLPFSADFETGNFPPQGMQVHNPQQDHGWQPSLLVSGRGMGTGALTINQYDNSLTGTLDWLLTPILDFSLESAPVLSFDVAYAPWDPRYSDTLAVFISTDCGEVFQNIYLRGGDALGTTEPLNRPFQPMAEEWRTERIDLSAFAGASHVQIAFVARNGYGNDLYLDNIHVGKARQAAPLADFRPSTTRVCAGSTVRFQDQSLQAPTRWIWSFPGGYPASDTTPNPTVTYDQPGTYDVTLTVANAGGTHHITRSSLIEVTSAPELALRASRTSICAGEAVTLTVVGEGRFTWDLGPGMESPHGRAITLKPRQDAVYAIRGASDSGCDVHSEVTVRVRDARPLEVSPPVTTICRGSSVSLSVTGADRYEWTPAAGLSATNSGYVEAAPTQTTTYTVTGRTREGCVLAREVTVNVQNAPLDFVLTAAKTTLCPGETVSLQAQGAASFNWTGPNLNRSQGNSVTAAPTQTATYRVIAETGTGCQAEKTLTLTVAPAPRIRALASERAVCAGAPIALSAVGASRFEWSPREELDQWERAQVTARPTVRTRFVVTGYNEAGCRDTASVLVGVESGPDLEILNPNPAMCPGGSVMLSASGGQSYQWYPSEGLDRTTGPRVIARPSRAMTYTVRGTGPNGCSTEKQTHIQIGGNLPPVAEFEADHTLTCAGQDVQFSSLSQQAASVRWEFPSGIPATSTELDPKVRFPEEGLHDVILTVRGCNGLESRQEARGYIVTTAPLQLGLNTRDVTICRGTPFRLVASGADTYRWTPAIGLDRTEGASVEALPTTRTTYTVTGTDAQGCKATRSVTLDLIGQGKTLTLKPQAPVICAGEAVSLRAEGGLTYSWFPQ
ncbi:MAG: PKD domain-containing protein, partial [Bacteroidetes bacterium]